MPQTFQVLRCYKCEVFQVHPTKKSNKWKCKLCDEKQSFKRFYALGTGKECRLHVQKLNGIRGEIDGAQEHSDTSDTSNISESSEHSEQDGVSPNPIAKKSKWMEYVDTMTEKNAETEEKHIMSDKNMHLNNTEVVLELPRKYPRKCLTVGNKIINETEIEPGNGIGSLNNSVKTSFMKHMGSNKSNSIKTSMTNPKKNVPAHTVVKNSKWTIYVEELEDTLNSHEANNTVQMTHTNNQSKPMFPFLEDEDIDSVLDL